MTDGWGAIAGTMVGRLVRLEPLAREHERALAEAAEDDLIWAWMPLDPRPDMSAWIEDALTRARAGLDVPFTTIETAHGRPIGSTRYLALRPADRSLEIGWTWVAPRAWGTGANVEAKLLMLRRAFDELGCLRVEFKTDAQNQRSRRALEALGATFEGIHRKHMLVRGGERRDSAWYSILDDEWPDVEARLARRLDGKS